VTNAEKRRASLGIRDLDSSFVRAESSIEDQLQAWFHIGICDVQTNKIAEFRQVDVQNHQWLINRLENADLAYDSKSVATGYS